MTGVWRRLRRRPLGTLSLAWLLIVVLASLAAPLLAPSGPGTQDLSHVFSGPSSHHWLGTGVLGQDVLVRLLYGGRVTLVGVLVSDALYTGLGVLMGLAAGYLGGFVEKAVLRLAEIVYSVPLIVVLLVVLAIFPGNELVAMVGLGLIGSPGLARVVRAQARGLRGEPYVQAAKLAGMGRWAIMRRHILPHVLGTVIVQVSLFSAAAVLLETGLGFLGVGATGATWGGLVSEASQNIGTQSWLLVPSGFLIVSFVLALGLAGDALRDGTTERLGGQETPVPCRPGRLTFRSAPPPVAIVGPDDRSGALLSVRDLTVAFPRDGMETVVVTEVDLDVMPGEAVGIVGESGCGKTVTARAVLGLLQGGGRATAGTIVFEGSDLLQVGSAEIRRVRGGRIGWVSQEPLASLNPSFTVGSQIVEAVRAHRPLARRNDQDQVLDLLRRVHLPRPEDVAGLYPHQLSGGMAQRVAVAAALAGDPVLLIADEPTTSLDVTVQAGILDLFHELRETGMAIVLVTHDWGVLADLCQRAVVMYAGQVVERADTSDLLRRVRHPYTEALMAADPRLAAPKTFLAAIEGAVPPPADWPAGCRFQSRCRLARPDCTERPVPLLPVGPEHESRCRHVDLVGTVGAMSSPGGPTGPPATPPNVVAVGLPGTVRR